MKQIKLSEYIANPRAASDYAKEHGDVQIIDETGEQRAVLSCLKQDHSLKHWQNAEDKHMKLHILILNSAMMEEDKYEAVSLLTDMWKEIYDAKSQMG